MTQYLKDTTPISVKRAILKSLIRSHQKSKVEVQFGNAGYV